MSGGLEIENLERSAVRSGFEDVKKKEKRRKHYGGVFLGVVACRRRLQLTFFSLFFNVFLSTHRLLGVFICIFVFKKSPLSTRPLLSLRVAETLSPKESERERERRGAFSIVGRNFVKLKTSSFRNR